MNAAVFVHGAIAMEDDVNNRPESAGGTPTTRIAPQDVPPYVSAALPREENVRDRRPHHVPVLGPVMLILAGSVFLLNNLGLVSWDVWGEVWRLWPIIPIAIGLDMILGRRSPALSIIVVLGVIAAGIGILYSNGGFEPEVETGPTPVNIPLEGAKRADVTLDFGAGDLSLSSLETGSAQLATGTLTNSGSRKEPEIESDLDGDTLQLDIKQRADGFGSWFGGNRKRTNWNIKLNPTVPLNLNVNAGASKANLDLGQLLVSSLDLDVGASDTTVIFPAKGPSTSVKIDAGAAHVRLVIPNGVAARVDASSSAASSMNVDSRFTQREDKIYETEGYSTAERKLTIELDAGAASIDIESR
ncbi:MAG: toast rack family protein [Chloroflexia bacterium]